MSILDDNHQKFSSSEVRSLPIMADSDNFLNSSALESGSQCYSLQDAVNAGGDFQGCNLVEPMDIDQNNFPTSALHHDRVPKPHSAAKHEPSPGDNRVDDYPRSSSFSTSEMEVRARGGYQTPEQLKVDWKPDYELPSGSSIRPDDRPAKKCFLCDVTNATLSCRHCCDHLFCESCSVAYHRHPKRKGHEPREIIRTPSPIRNPEPEWTPQRSVKWLNESTDSRSSLPGTVPSKREPLDSAGTSLPTTTLARSPLGEKMPTVSGTDGGEWPCTFCTFLNSGDVIVCEVCSKTDEAQAFKKQKQLQEMSRRKALELHEIEVNEAAAERLRREEVRDFQTRSKTNNSDLVKQSLGTMPNAKISPPAVHKGKKWEKRECSRDGSVKITEVPAHGSILDQPKSEKGSSDVKAIESQARMLLALEEVSSYERAFVAASLVAEGYDRDVSIVAAATCDRLEDAKSFVVSQFANEEQLHKPQVDRDREIAENIDKEEPWKIQTGSRRSGRLADKNHDSEFPPLPDVGKNKKFDSSSQGSKSSKGSPDNRNIKAKDGIVIQLFGSSKRKEDTSKQQEGACSYDAESQHSRDGRRSPNNSNRKIKSRQSKSRKSKKNKTRGHSQTSDNIDQDIDRDPDETPKKSKSHYFCVIL